MTVQEMIEELAKLPPHSIVRAQKYINDWEGDDVDRVEWRGGYALVKRLRAPRQENQ